MGAGVAGGEARLRGGRVGGPTGAWLTAALLGCAPGGAVLSSRAPRAGPPSIVLEPVGSPWSAWRLRNDSTERFVVRVSEGPSLGVEERVGESDWRPTLALYAPTCRGRSEREVTVGPRGTLDVGEPSADPERVAAGAWRVRANVRSVETGRAWVVLARFEVPSDEAPLLARHREALERASRSGCGDLNRWLVGYLRRAPESETAALVEGRWLASLSLLERWIVVASARPRWALGRCEGRDPAVAGCAALALRLTLDGHGRGLDAATWERTERLSHACNLPPGDRGASDLSAPAPARPPDALCPALGARLGEAGAAWRQGPTMARGSLVTAVYPAPGP